MDACGVQRFKTSGRTPSSLFAGYTTAAGTYFLKPEERGKRGVRWKKYSSPSSATFFLCSMRHSAAVSLFLVAAAAAAMAAAEEEKGKGGERQKDKAAYITSPLSPSSDRGRKKKNLFYGPTTEEGRRRGRGERQKAIDRLWGAV